MDQNGTWLSELLFHLDGFQQDCLTAQTKTLANFTGACDRVTHFVQYLTSL